jgi:Ca-activated chloride channel family protein
MEAKEMETRIYSDYKEQFQYFAAIALFFILLDFIILERKNRWLSNIDIFKPTRKFTPK